LATEERVRKVKMSTTPTPIIYFNIGWMKRYAGVVDDDETQGGHGYLKGHRHGGESFNFSKCKDGKVRGHRPPGSSEKTNITKMGVDKKAAEISGALVVWIAKEPASGRSLIVGWYRNATVYREARSSNITLNGHEIFYSAEVAASDAVLLPPLIRTFQVASSRTNPGAGFGQKPTWYGAEEVDKRVWDYIRAYDSRRHSSTKPTKKSPFKNFDPELRRKVEKAAVAHAIAYFTELYGRNALESVESYAKGWDLEVVAGQERLLVEVKGLTNSELVCELTPNEYKKMMLPVHRASYIVYVVNNALAEPPAVPIASIFKHASGKRWVTDDGRELIITPKTAAVLSCS